MINFIRGANPVWYFVNLQGIQFDDTYWLWTLQNELPYLPAPVYETPTGTPWSDPIQFLSNGTLPIEIYFDPTQVYRLEIRQHVGLGSPSQSDPLIYVIPNYSPNGEQLTPAGMSNDLTGNQIANPQFVNVNFNSPFVLSSVTNPPPIEIAPGWFLILQGTGSITLNQVALNNSNENPTNAPYALRLTISGTWSTTPILRQRFQQNGMLWANKYVAGSITALINGSAQPITARLVDSNGTTLGSIMNPTVGASWAEYLGNVLLPATTNPNTPPAAYIDYQILLPQVVDIYLTSIQVTVSNLAQNYTYEQDSVDRQIDHLFHYYQPKLNYKPINSYLVGWDFPKNPGQLGYTWATAAMPSGANLSTYTWDQTILFQSVSKSVSVAQGSSDEYVISNASGAGTQVAVIQYLDQAEAIEILNGNVSVNIAGYSTNGGGISGTVSLWCTAGTVQTAMTSNNSIVATLNSAGYPATFNQPTGGTWTEITPQIGGAGSAIFTLGAMKTSGPTQYNDIQINSFGLNNAGAITSATVKQFAIVVGFANLANGATIVLESISLVPGDIATRPAVKSLAETLFDCQQYYEQSYLPSEIVSPAVITNQILTTGPITTNNALISDQAVTYVPATNKSFFTESGFSISYLSVKRSTSPSINLFSPSTGTKNVIDTYLSVSSALVLSTDVVSSFWGTINSSNRVSSFFRTAGPSSSTGTVGQGAGTWIFYHYTSDARLGIVT
jgi:hypothetical protein